MPNDTVDRPRVGLALSGGTLKAAAHIGVIEALAELGIRPHVVAGTSAGSLVAALYAHGYSPVQMKQLTKRFSLWSLVQYGFPVLSSAVTVMSRRLGWRYLSRLVPAAQGLLSAKRLERYVYKALQRRTARIPYYIIATDLLSGNPVTFSNESDAIVRGLAERLTDPARTVAASCALPGVFSPVELGRYLLVDGAFRHYVPVKILQQMGCTRIIAVNLYQLDEDWQPDTLVHVLVRSFEILLRESIDNDIDSNNLVVLEPNVQNMTWFSVSQLNSCIEAGHECVLESKAAILNLL